MKKPTQIVIKITITSIPQTLKEFKCSFCEMKFNTKSLFMKHRRENHPKNISECRDGDFCKFGVKCWYRHTENSVSYSNQKVETNIEVNETMNRLFSIMEKYGERIEYIEKQM